VPPDDAPPPDRALAPEASGWACGVCLTGGNEPGREHCRVCRSLCPAPFRAPAPAPAPAAKPKARAAPKAAAAKPLGAFFAAVPAPRVEPAELPPCDADGLADCPGASEGMRIDPRAAATYVYPAQREQREYQLHITRRALFVNTLVCLPTGMVRKGCRSAHCGCTVAARCR
jgi:hypothetical protein